MEDMTKDQLYIGYVNGHLEGIMSLANTIKSLLVNNEPGEYISAEVVGLSDCVSELALAAMEAMPNFSSAEAEGK